jgi:hypothetical protein
MQGEVFLGILWQVSCIYILVWKRKIFLTILMATVILCTLKSTCRPLCNIGHAPCNTNEHAYAKIEVSTLECQISWGNNCDEVVNHQCNLTSK